MSLDQKIAELLEFYSMDELKRYGKEIGKNNWDKDAAWDFLNEFTIADYALTDKAPNMGTYILLYQYKHEGGNFPPNCD